MADAGDPAQFVHPPQTPLFRALNAARYGRQDVIRQIEQVTQRRLICYVGSRTASFDSSDISGFEDLLSDVDEGVDLDVMLHTQGGDIDQAERLARTLDRHVGKATLRMVVPSSAKSAGTLICLGGNEIVMGEPSELGPIDPQIWITAPNGSMYSRPAKSFLDGLEDIVKAVGTGPLPQPYFPLLDKLDPALIDFCKKAQIRSKKLAARLLASRMFKDDADGKRKATRIATELNRVERYLSHGAVITAADALALKLNVNHLRRRDPLWQAYWRLFCILEVEVQQLPPGGRIFEGRKVSLVAVGAAF